MKTSVLVAVIVAGVFAVSSFSCGTTTTCSAATCSSGCCDTAGRCQSGLSSTACGSRGAVCSICSLGNSCVNGTCSGSISGSGGGSSGVGGGTSATGGGSSATGGGSSSVGGGSSGVGGGSSGVGGGSSSVGGGSSGVGGGSSSVGGGSSGVGGGSSGVGGGTPGTGGGSASGTAYCTRLEQANTRFFAGRSSCSSMGLTIMANFSRSRCVAAYPSCTSTDRTTLDSVATCLESAQICSTGNEMAAINAFFSCLAPAQELSEACQSAVGIE